MTENQNMVRPIAREPSAACVESSTAIPILVLSAKTRRTRDQPSCQSATHDSDNLLSPADHGTHFFRIGQAMSRLYHRGIIAFFTSGPDELPTHEPSHPPHLRECQEMWSLPSTARCTTVLCSALPRDTRRCAPSCLMDQDVDVLDSKCAPARIFMITSTVFCVAKRQAP